METITRRLPPGVEVAFVPAWADRVEHFFERILTHTKGRWARSPFVLEPWQRDEIIRPLFGTARWDDDLQAWVRLYNEAWLELGRGNGKSEKLAGIALYMLSADGEDGAEVYGAAADRDQAGLVFAVAERMVELSPILSRRLTVVSSKRRIVDPKTASVYQVIAADAAGNLGQGPHCIVFDEVIAQPSRDLYDTLRTGLGKRHQPLLIAATTAGNNPEAFAATEHETALRVAADPGRQFNRFVYIRNTPRRVAADVADAWETTGEPDEDGTLEVDPWAEANWHHANPALGSFLQIATLRAEAAAAQDDPTKENAFRQFRLNQWVSQTTRALPLHVWDATAGLVDASELKGREAWAGLDLAATSDLAAYALLFPPADAAEPFRALWRYFAPRGALAELNNATGGRFDVWERQGLVNVSAGDVIDYDEIHEALEADARTFDLADLGADPWNSSSTIAWAQRSAAVEIVAVPQTYAHLSPPTKELLRLVRERRLAHGGHPVTRWNVDSLELRRDHADNVRPVKPDRSRSGRRIDGVLALILALDGYMRRGQHRRRSAYESRGLDVI